MDKGKGKQPAGRAKKAAPPSAGVLDGPAKQRSDAGQTHKQLHKKLVKSATTWCDKWDIAHHGDKVVPIRSFPGGQSRYFSTQRTGFPDLFIYEGGMQGRENRNGLAVEFKCGGDVMSPAQNQWFEKLRKRNFRCWSCLWWWPMWCGLGWPLAVPWSDTWCLRLQM
jgi:hypothetical protein